MFTHDSQVVVEPRTTTEVEVSVVIPCLNEARTVGGCIESALSALRQIPLRSEVVVGDNGSSDGSPEIACAHGARVVSTSRRGYGCALQAGIAAAQGRYIIVGDADGSYDFGCLEEFLQRLRQGDDLVVGNRFQGGILPGAMPWLHRRIGNPGLTAALNLLFRSPIHDTQCGLRAFRKEAYRRWRPTSPGMEFASEMIAKACLLRSKISEVPIILYPDGRDRPPHLRSFRDGWRILCLLLALCPFWLYLIPAGLFVLSGFGLMWLRPGTGPRIGVGVSGQLMVIGALCVLLGIGAKLAGGRRSPGERRLYPRWWDHQRHPLVNLRNSLNRILERFAKPQAGQVIVDIGCGDRPYEPLFRNSGCAYIACDVQGKVDVQVAPGQPICLPDACAHGVVSFQVLEHVWDLDWYLGECRRLLKPEGWLLLSTHGSWLYHPHPTDYRRWTRDGLVRELEERGFAVERIEALVGPLAWTTQFRLLGMRHILLRMPVVGRVLLVPLICLMNVRMVFEDLITPPSIREVNACTYVAFCRKSANPLAVEP